jgi:hypothetical protein
MIRDPTPEINPNAAAAQVWDLIDRLWAHGTPAYRLLAEASALCRELGEPVPFDDVVRAVCGPYEPEPWPSQCRRVPDGFVLAPADVRRREAGRRLARLLAKHAEELEPVLAELLAPFVADVAADLLRRSRKKVRR